MPTSSQTPTTNYPMTSNNAIDETALTNSATMLFNYQTELSRISNDIENKLKKFMKFCSDQKADKGSVQWESNETVKLYCR